MKLSDLSYWNPWWEGKYALYENLKKFYDFSFLATRKRKINFSKNWIIRGPRQVGKTVYLYRLIREAVYCEIALPETITYIFCDRLGGRKELRNIIRDLKELMITKKEGKLLFLDEVNSLKNWEKVYKEICEENFFKVIATGSRPKELEEVAEYFPGRNVEIMNFYPLSFKEYVESFLESFLNKEIEITKNYSFSRSQNQEKIWNFFEEYGFSFGSIKEIAQNLLPLLKEIPYDIFNLFNLEEVLNFFKKLFPYFRLLNFLFQKYLQTGGYPDAIEKEIKKEPLPFEIVIKDTLGTVEKEGLSVEILNRLIPKLLLNIGSKISFSNLANFLDIETKTLIKYIEVLERSFLLREILFFDGKIHPKKERKFYFCDPFLIKAFENYYSVKEVEEGKLVENIVAEHLARYLEDPFRRLWKNQIGYTKEKRKEIDFLIKKGDNLLKIEVKYKESPKDFSKKTDFVLTKDEFISDKKPYQIPVSIFLLVL